MTDDDRGTGQATQQHCMHGPPRNKSCISFMGEQEIGAVILPRDPCKKVGQRRALINGAPWQIWVYGLWQQERGKDDRPESSRVPRRVSSSSIWHAIFMRNQLRFCGAEVVN